MAEPHYLVDSATRAAYQAEDEIDLRELWAIIWGGRWWIVLLTLISGAGAVTYALQQPNIYRSEALLTTAAPTQESAASRLASQFGGLASLAGVDLGGGAGSNITVALEVMKSRTFIGDFIRRHQLQLPLMASEGWDSEQQQWIINPAIYDTQQQQWVREVKPGRSPMPSDLQMYAVFSGVLSTEQDKSGLIRVAIELQSPQVAQQWVSWLIADLNEHLRQRDKAEAQRTIAYLQDQLQRTALTDMQSIFLGLIEQQTRGMMMADVRQEYLLKTIDPAVVPEQPVKPKRRLIAVLGVVLGGMLGVFWVFVRHALRRQPAAAALEG